MQRKFIPSRRIIQASTGESFEIKITDDGYIRVMRTYEKGEESLKLISDNGKEWILTIDNLGRLKLTEGVE